MSSLRLRGEGEIRVHIQELGLLDGKVSALELGETDVVLAPLDVPVGFDGYSYGLRDITGQKVHLSRPKTFMEPFGTGDVIGMHISLPPAVKTEDESQQQQDKQGVFRDRIPIRFRGQLYFEQPDYTASKEMDDLMNPILPPQSQNNPSLPVPRPSFLAL